MLLLLRATAASLLLVMVNDHFEAMRLVENNLLNELKGVTSLSAWMV
jgi:hypothetical protein